MNNCIAKPKRLDHEWFVYHFVRLAMEGKLSDVAMLARRYANRMEDRVKAKELCELVAAHGYRPSILRKLETKGVTHDEKLRKFSRRAKGGEGMGSSPHADHE